MIFKCGTFLEAFATIFNHYDLLLDIIDVAVIIGSVTVHQIALDLFSFVEWLLSHVEDTTAIDEYQTAYPFIFFQFDKFPHYVVIRKNGNGYELNLVRFQEGLDSKFEVRSK